MKQLIYSALIKAKNNWRKVCSRSAQPLLKLCALLMLFTTFSLQAWGADATYYVWDASANDWAEYVVQDENISVVKGPEVSGYNFVGWHIWNPDVYPNWILTSSGYIKTDGDAYYSTGGENSTKYVRFFPNSAGNTAEKNTGKNEADNKLYAIYVPTATPYTGWTKNSGWSAGSTTKITVTFYANGGTGDSYTQSMLKSTSTMLHICEFEAPTGKVFSGWATSSSGSVAYTEQQIASFSSDQNLYAIWADECEDISGSTVTIHDITPVWNCSTNQWDATVSWDAVSAATRYRLLLQKKDGSWTDVGDVVTLSAPTTSYTFTNLTQGLQHRVGVAAQNNSCEPSTATPTTTSSTFTPTCPSVTASGTTSDITANSATISWSASSAVSCSYTYEVVVQKHSDASEIWSTSTPISTTSYNLTGLDPNTRYDVTLQAYNTCEESDIIEYNFTTTKSYVNYVYTCIDISLIQTDGATSTPLYITSAAGQKVKAVRTLTLDVSGADGTKDVTLSGQDLLFYKSDGTQITGSVLQTTSGSLSDQEIYVAYAPTAYVSEVTASPTITVSCDGNNVPFTNLVEARCLPDNFVIAAKWGGNWYALPANCTSSSSSTAGIPIVVDSEENPTSATALSTAKYGLRQVANTRYPANGTNLVFTERLTTATADNQKTLYNGSKTNIQVNAQYNNYTGTNPARYEWAPSTDNLQDYLLTSVATLTGDEAETGEKPRTISINNSGVFGTLMQDKSNDGKVRLLPATWVEPAEMQVVEWKANSVVIMYLGNATSATTTVGSNSASASQTLASQEMMHGVYELSTAQPLTSYAGKTLAITMSDATQKLVVIPMIVSGSTTAGADVTNDVVVLKDATLTAATTKYTFKNITVYGGGKLSIPSGTSIGMSSLTLRAGNLTTNGTGGSVAYSYDYPQVALTGTMTNTAAKINLDYITDYDHWYHLTLPFAAKLKDITRPQEFYGDAVTANNNGSWEIDCYDGAIRATGVYNSWQDIEGADYLGASGDDRALTAGKGYMMWAAPLKVQKTGESSKTRQTYGIHRFVMSVAADAAKTAETSDKNITVYAHPAEKNNDYGWNLVGNPYMANLSELASTTLKVGELVKEMKDDKWTGKWIWSETSQTENYRYVTVPTNDFSSYEAMKVTGTSVSLSPFKVFFIQVDGETANQEKSLVFDHTKRAASIQSHLKLINEEVETGMIMQHTNFADEKLGFLLSDVYSDAYEKQADYPKMMNPTNYNLYGVHEVGELSFVATSPAIASTSMAIGYQVPEAGDYTLRFDEDSYDRTEVKNLYVTDYGVEPNITTDLMENDYIFHVNQAETNNTRFVVSIVLTPKEPEEPGVETNLEAVDTYQDQPVKFIYQDKMYILHRGVIYDATGKKVRQINK